MILAGMVMIAMLAIVRAPRETVMPVAARESMRREIRRIAVEIGIVIPDRIAAVIVMTAVRVAEIGSTDWVIIVGQRATGQTSDRA